MTRAADGCAGWAARMRSEPHQALFAWGPLAQSHSNRLLTPDTCATCLASARNSFLEHGSSLVCTAGPQDAAHIHWRQGKS